MKLINTLALLAFLFLSNTAYTQELEVINVQPENFSATQRKMQARKDINDLKTGVLLFRLKTNDKAVKKLERILNNPATSEASKKRIRERTMPDIKASAEKINGKLKRAFTEAYDFTDVYFMPDNCTNALQNGDQITCLTDADGKAVSADVLKDKTIFLADFSELENDKTSRIKGLIISDKNSRRLASPFPYFQRSGGVFVKLSSNTITQKDAIKMVEIWNAKLHAFFKQK